ncbi:hypothetical protein NECAME_09281 [Necator americanus]|uniref:Endonuclease/exonuclease/phosphatase domain-containing protein n=1 Tax=Necator americanus TaxID=51031 RepID=W2TEH2_NECAM|nr:hypothetical protein NECAME_09281 [Necator americanus]ETN80228.1 hypothetical protein NECAME_09281 [Necator americanus]
MAICTYNARTFASDAAIEDLMMQAKKIKYDVIGLTETRRRHPLNAVYETGGKLFLGTCDSRGAGGVGVLVNASMAKNIGIASFEQLTTRIGRLRMRRCGPTPALTPAFGKIPQWTTSTTNMTGSLNTFTTAAKKAESSKTTKRRLSLETLELIRQRGAARAAGNQELTSVLARLFREAIKKDLKERRADVLAEAAEAGKKFIWSSNDANDSSSSCVGVVLWVNYLWIILFCFRYRVPLVDSL